MSEDQLQNLILVNRPTVISTAGSDNPTGGGIGGGTGWGHGIPGKHGGKGSGGAFAPGDIPANWGAIVPDTVTAQRWMEISGYFHAMELEEARIGIQSFRAKLNDTATYPNSRLNFNRLTKFILRFIETVIQQTKDGEWDAVVGVFNETNIITSTRYAITMRAVRFAFEFINNRGIMTIYDALYQQGDLNMANMQTYLWNICYEMF